MLISIRFGTFDEDREFTEKSEITFVPGVSYGYDLEILAAEEDVEVVDFLLLPGAAQSLPDPINAITIDDVERMRNDHVIRGDRIIEKQERIHYARGFRIAEGDPLGKYAMLVFVNDQLNEYFRFVLIG